MPVAAESAQITFTMFTTFTVRSSQLGYLPCFLLPEEGQLNSASFAETATPVILSCDEPITLDCVCGDQVVDLLHFVVAYPLSSLSSYACNVGRDGQSFDEPRADGELGK